jgi:hypothetical protein
VGTIGSKSRRRDVATRNDCTIQPLPAVVRYSDSVHPGRGDPNGVVEALDSLDDNLSISPVSEPLEVGDRHR